MYRFLLEINFILLSAFNLIVFSEEMWCFPGNPKFDDVIEISLKWKTMIKIGAVLTTVVFEEEPDKMIIRSLASKEQSIVMVITT